MKDPYKEMFEKLWQQFPNQNDLITPFARERLQEHLRTHFIPKSRVREVIEGMMKLPTEDQEHGVDYDEGYDTALADLSTALLGYSPNQKSV